MSERITEDIVRDHFKGDPLFSQCVFEEQKSKNPRIDKLLQVASKAGKGKGKPEFLISFPDLYDFLIVIECKADLARHESAERNKYSDYAVDGALLYASNLSRQFDTLAIAVSGLESSTSKISHFFWPKGAASYDSRPADTKLVSIHSYLTSYRGLIAAAHIEGLRITEKAVEYNKLLNDYSIPETERAIFISAILVGLQDVAFRHSYKHLTNPADLANEIISASERVLSSHDLDAERRATVLSQYKTILNQDIAKSPLVKSRHEPKPKKNTILRDVAADIHEHIFPLTSSGQSGFDVLGKFYTEFIRYSGSDARTGLVLTPQHITWLFCDLAGLTDATVVLDPCCGTGGFLTAAMQFMWNKAGSDEQLKERIKTTSNHWG